MPPISLLLGWEEGTGPKLLKQLVWLRITESGSPTPSLAPSNTCSFVTFKKLFSNNSNGSKVFFPKGKGNQRSMKVLWLRCGHLVVSNFPSFVTPACSLQPSYFPTLGLNPKSRHHEGTSSGLTQSGKWRQWGGLQTDGETCWQNQTPPQQ